MISYRKMSKLKLEDNLLSDTTNKKLIIFSDRFLIL